MKKRRLSLRAETVRVLSVGRLVVARGGVIAGPTNGDVECPTTLGFPGCEPPAPGTGMCTVLCPGTHRPFCVDPPPPP